MKTVKQYIVPLLMLISILCAFRFGQVFGTREQGIYIAGCAFGWLWSGLLSIKKL